jgi:hypothetical protein
MASTNSADASPVARLKADADEGSYMSYLQAGRWAKIYYGSRGALILFSTLTSAQAVIAIPHVGSAQAIFALLVTLITGFDVWLKPGAKYRALYAANDQYAELRQKLDLCALMR